MPRQMDLREELAKMRQQVASGQSDSRDRQFTVRPDAETALRFLEECVEKGQVPALRLAELMADHYRTTRPEVALSEELQQLQLPEDKRALLEHIADLKKTTPGIVLSGLVEKHLLTELMIAIREARAGTKS